MNRNGIVIMALKKTSIEMPGVRRSHAKDSALIQ